ncbi:MAG: hypothetical protein QXG97_00765 [Nitrososphaerota archaeon]
MVVDKINLDASALISLDELGRDKSKLIRLSYPVPDQNYASTILQSLCELGVDAICLEPFMGKGFRNVVLAGIWRGELVATKIRRIDSVVKDTIREATIHRMANEVGVGPRLLGNCGPVILMELIEGEDLSSWLLKITDEEVEEAREVISDLLSQCFSLDRAGIDHDELSDASKHVLRRGRNVVILDFGSAKITLKPSNLTSIISYLFYGPVRRVVVDILDMEKPSIEDLRQYKSNISLERFEEIYHHIIGRRLVG